MARPKIDTQRRDENNRNFYKMFGAIMKQKRTEAGITAERMAAFIDSTRGSVQNIEKGTYALNFLVGMKVARLLKIDIQSLMDTALEDIANMVARE